MGQFLRLVILLVGLWLVLQIIKRALAKRNKPSPQQPTLTNMIACDRCGVHIPESEAIREDDRLYCSEAHRKAAKSERP